MNKGTDSDSDSDNGNSRTFGPVLPKKLQKNNSNKSEELTETNKHNSDDDCIESDEVSDVYGPSLAKCTKTTSNDIHSNQNATTNKSNSETETNNVYGPSLPPNLNKQTFLSTQSTINQHETESDNGNSDDESCIGPQPHNLPSNSQKEYELELRAFELRTKSNNKSKEKKERESWMLELPDVTISKALGARTFRANPGPDFSDRSAWTDTPEHSRRKKEKSLDKIKSELKSETELLDLETREREQEKIVKKLNKKSKRNQSLLEIHREKLKKKKKDTEVQERRPFNRDIDLKLNTLSPSKKAKFIESASVLNSKFSSGKTKYL